MNDDLLVNYLIGLCDDTERKKALDWIRQSLENKRHFNELRAIYEASKLIQPINDYNIESSLFRVKALHYRNQLVSYQKNDRENTRRFRIEVLKYAALIFFVISLGIISYEYLHNRPKTVAEEIWNTIEAPFGSRTRLTLADGTDVWLNSGSQLRYSTKFGQENRHVYLNGEAYFDVAKDKKNQFIVSTSHLDVKVYGTQFNVKAYSEENIIQTTLLKGSIIIEEKGAPGTDTHKVVLKPNEIATFYFSEDNKNNKDKPAEMSQLGTTPKRNIEVVSNINSKIFTSWKDKRWIIDGESLSSLAVKLERRYNVRIIIDAKELQDYKFTGTIKEETLEQVLTVIKLSAPIDYIIENNQVNLFKNKTYKNSYDEFLTKDK